MLARVFCQGGEAETAKKGVYKGIETCVAATFAGGGDKLCNIRHAVFSGKSEGGVLGLDCSNPRHIIFDFQKRENPEAINQ